MDIGRATNGGVGFDRIDKARASMSERVNATSPGESNGAEVCPMKALFARGPACHEGVAAPCRSGSDCVSVLA